MSPVERRRLFEETVSWIKRYVDEDVIESYSRQKYEFVSNTIAGHIMAMWKVSLEDARQLSEEAMNLIVSGRHSFN